MLWDELGLRACDNLVLQMVFVPKSKVVTGNRGKLHNEQFHDLYSSPYVIRMIKKN